MNNPLGKMTLKYEKMINDTVESRLSKPNNPTGPGRGSDKGKVRVSRCRKKKKKKKKKRKNFDIIYTGSQRRGEGTRETGVEGSLEVSGQVWG